MFANLQQSTQYHGLDGASGSRLAPVVPSFEPRPLRSDWRVRFGRCEVRAACREVLVDGCMSPLQPRPFDLLVYLIEHRDRVVTIDELLDQVWSAASVQQGSLAAAIMRIRKALREHEIGTGTIIRTYQRVGYRFVAPVEGEPVPR